MKRRTHGSASTTVLVVATAFILAASATSSIHARELTFEERVTAQQAIERVYWNHRIWPEQNRRAKPSLGEVLSDASIRAKVTRYLSLSDALAKEPGRLISERQLRDEMNRMVARTNAPDVLRELFAALGNDPLVIEETLARRTLVDRLAPDVSVARGSGKALTSLGALTAPASTASGSSPAFTVGCGSEAWNSTGTGPGVPQGREFHSAVWTGSEMIVWGGVASDGSRLDTGGRYDPATDSWSAVSAVGAPEPRNSHTAVWTGDELIVWGGTSQTGLLQTGGRYDPATDTWTPTSSIGAPEARTGHTAVWTGNEMIVWGGGTSAGFTAAGSRYDPMTDTWTPTSTALAPTARNNHSALWMSGSMIVWGGDVGPPYVRVDTGGRYDPSTDTWLATSTAGAPSGRSFHTAVGTGRTMIVWGGFTANGPTTSGGRYDPSADLWIPTSNVGVPPGCGYHTAVWTGDRMIVWGGWGSATGDTDTGGRYAPANDSWAPTSTLGAPERRGHHTAVWTGTEMIIWGGTYSATSFNSGGRYCPGCDDQNPCTTDADDPVSGCTHTVTVGAPCDDGNSCTVQDSCDGTGACVGQPLPPNAPCDDRDACTADEACSAELSCAGGVPVACDDGNPCTTDGCDPATGCTHVNNTEPCSAGDACTVDACSAGSCVVGPPRNCDDSNVCTADSCDPSIGCVHVATNEGASCNDGNVCTTNDSCREGACRGDVSSDGTSCWDYDACTTNDTCVAGSCIGGPPPDCDDANTCTLDRCDPAIGCTHYNNFEPCDDHNACTSNDRCTGGGTCTGTSPVHCPFERDYGGNVCTGFQICDPVLYCVWVTPPLNCDDDSVCTTDWCDPDMPYMGCRHAQISCDDGNPCTDDICDPATGCINTDNVAPCDDGNPCTTNDACLNGVCTGPNTALDEPNPRTNGYYKRLCIGPHSGDMLTAADAPCVAQVAPLTFGSVATVADICTVIGPSQRDNDTCEQSEDDLMVLALNICRARVCPAQSIDSHCGSNSGVGQSLAEADAILGSPSRDREACSHAKCLAEEINTGRALEMNTLTLAVEGSDVRLTWEPPYLSDGTGQPKRYHVWRRAQGSWAPFEKIGDTVAPTFLDATAGIGAVQYEITAVMN